MCQGAADETCEGGEGGGESADGEEQNLSSRAEQSRAEQSILDITISASSPYSLS